MNDRLLSLLGIARKAGKLVFGRDRAAEAIAQSRPNYCLLAKTSPRNPKKKCSSSVKTQRCRL